MKGSSSNAEDTDDVVMFMIDELSEVRELSVLDVLFTSIVDSLLGDSFSR